MKDSKRGLPFFEGWLKRIPEKAMEYAMKMIDFIVLIALIPFIAFLYPERFHCFKKNGMVYDPEKNGAIRDGHSFVMSMRHLAAISADKSSSVS
ncbi:hypothetical protein RCO48_16340 [Peribacillus frigoritolerans]|nr:hypothetical protein [Peribacillus frigoritolerans]